MRVIMQGRNKEQMQDRDWERRSYLDNGMAEAGGWVSSARRGERHHKAGQMRNAARIANGEPILRMQRLLRQQPSRLSRRLQCLCIVRADISLAAVVVVVAEASGGLEEEGEGKKLSRARRGSRYGRTV